jgi:hypothetical protein
MLTLLRIDVGYVPVAVISGNNKPSAARNRT